MAVFRQAPQLLSGKAVGNRQDVLHVVLASQTDRLIGSPQKRDAPQGRSPATGVFIQESDNAIVEPPVALDESRQAFGVLAAGDHQRSPVLRRVERRPDVFPHETTDASRTTNQQNRAAAIEQQHGPRDVHVGQHDSVDRKDQQRGKHRDANQANNVCKGHVPPPAVKSAEHIEQNQLDADKPRQRVP